MVLMLTLVLCAKARGEPKEVPEERGSVETSSVGKMPMGSECRAGPDTAERLFLAWWVSRSGGDGSGGAVSRVEEDAVATPILCLQDSQHASLTAGIQQ